MAAKATLDNTIGAAFLGLSASCLLTGIAIVQAHLYYRNHPRDWMFQKVAVGVLIALAVLHMAFTLHALYFYLITNFGNPKALRTVIWSFKLEVIFNTIMVVLVQSLYAMRVWKLGNHFSRFWPALVGFIVAGGWGVGILSIANACRQTDFGNLDSMRNVIYATFSTATAVDIIIATAMCYYLNRSRSPFQGTNHKIFLIMRYVLISGFLTSACSLSTLISYATMPYNLVFIGIDFLLPNLYVNSYFAMLNARKYINEREMSGSGPLNIVSGSSFRTDLVNPHSVDGKADGVLYFPYRTVSLSPRDLRRGSQKNMIWSRMYHLNMLRSRL
ncbi:hypothetical protein M413DRAFT_257046 [Hebeloma cylindrosporum]|uniref:DUF6534 domain-containing protein n=1 Tax=Hebeloma cylindrosporum TaxID=76867 RepID=A0A0C2XI59_HEBCY|nr:hypothetical protein M413DRAFT_257046 [Hebeloma cylindrosporum h7]